MATWKTSEKAVELFNIQICCTFLVYLSACLRFWARSMKKHAIHDKLMYISVLLYTAQAVIIIFGIVEGGIGQHAHNIDKAEITKGFATWYFGELIYAILSCLVKTSVAVYILQVYMGKSSEGVMVNRPFIRKGVTTCLVLVWATSTVFLFTSIFQCSPVGYFWGQFQSSDGSGKCLKSIVPITGIVLSVVLALSDWALALVPIISIWKLQLPWKKKIVIQGLSSLGVLAGIAMLVRIPFIKVLDPTKDFLYETVDVAKWTVIEATLGIVAGCLPTIWPLLRLMKSRCFSSRVGQVEDQTLNHRVRIEGAYKGDAILNNHNTMRNNRNTIHLQREFFISDHVDHSGNHAAYRPDDYFYRTP